jgi:hypothetical protein
VKPKRLDFFEEQSSKTATSSLTKDEDALFTGQTAFFDEILYSDSQSPDDNYGSRTSISSKHLSLKR